MCRVAAVDGCKLRMWYTLKRLSAGLIAIALAAAILLVTDKPSHRETKRSLPRVALLQHASQAVIDDGAAGVLAGLAESGFVDGETMQLTRFNAEGDMGTSAAIAQQIVNDDYALVLTLSTPSLQAVANANKESHKQHVFALVTDPTIAGVGVGKEPLDHPPYMVGIGTLQPMKESLLTARKMFPGLRKVGMVWNPAEVNSEVTTKLARKACEELQIELLEANAENTSSVREAASSLISRGVEALWVGGDVTVSTALETMLGPAKDAGIPVWTVLPGNAVKGALFDLGANYFEVGRSMGMLAAKVLNGTSPAKLPVALEVPPTLYLNELALEGLKEKWTFPADLVSKADVTIDAEGTHEKAKRKPVDKEAKSAHAPLSKTWNVRILEYVDIPDVIESEQGVRDGIRAAGLVEDRDYRIKVANAQGEMATLAGLADAAVADQADLVVTASTPTLQTAIKRIHDTPIVFTFLANPIAAGAGKSDTDHLPNVTGAYGGGDVVSMVALIQQIMPHAKRVGTIYVPTEVNSVYNYEQFLEAAKPAKYEVIALGVSTPGEIPDAAIALCEKRLDLVCLTTSNLASASFPSIVQATRRAQVPVFAFLSSLADQGAAVVLARDYYDMGHTAGKLAARVMRGADPGQLPFEPARVSRRLFNVPAARECGLTIPPELLKQADKVIGE